jgi:glycosyltransferase A (GT-A) superfamily protein (DUF2064 family)
MAKAPAPGFVKTRLCPPCTPGEAAAIAEASLRDTLDAALESGHPVVLALEGPPGKWLPRGIDVVPQSSGSFNRRLHDAWMSLESGGVQIGMDTPQASASMLRHAFDALTTCGSAFGPATDGGWWLLGASRPYRAMFTRIAMSTAQTGERQLERMRSLGLQPLILPTLTDIDTWCTATRVAADIPGSRTARAVALVHDRLSECRV